MKSKHYLILIALLAVAFLSFPVKAEETYNETINFNGGGTQSETVGLVAAGNSTSGAAGSKDTIIDLWVNFDNIKIVDNTLTTNNIDLFTDPIAQITLTSAANGINAQYTGFTASVYGGSQYGSGYLGWERTTGNNINYRIYFTDVDIPYAKSLTGWRQLGLSYSRTVFTDYLTDPVSGANGRDCIKTSALFYLINTSAGSGNGRITCLASGSNAQQMSFTVNDNFILSFNNLTATGFVNGTKSLVNFRVKIVNSTDYIYYDQTSTSDVSQLVTKQTGVKANISHVGLGIWANRTLVDAQGTPQGAPTAAPTPPPGQAGTDLSNCTKPDTGANVCFDKDSYFVGDNVNVSWYLSDTVQNNLYNKNLVLTLNGVAAIPGFLACPGCVSISSQNGYYIYQATTPGTLTGDVKQGIVNFDTIGSGTVVIQPPGNSWLAVANTTMYTRTLNNVSYHVGFSVDSYPAAAIEIQINDVSNGNLVDVLFPTDFPDGTMTFGQVHPIPVGSFSIRLVDDVTNQVLDTKYFTAIPSPLGVPPAGISTSAISVDKTTYFYGDFMYVDYRVDDNNFSNYNYTLMAHIISLDQGNVTTKMFITPFEEQVGTFTSLVNIDKTMKCDQGMNCYFNTGNNSINVVLMNSTTGTANAITLAYANFTVSATTVDGYGLQVSTTTPTVNTPFTATITIPASNSGFFQISNAGTSKQFFADNQTINNTGLTSYITTLTEIIQPVGTGSVAYWVAELYGDDGILKVRIPLTVSQTILPPNPTGWVPQQDNIGTTCSAWDGWAGMIFAGQGLNDTTRQEFSLLLIFIAIAMGLVLSKMNFGVGIIFGFFPYAFSLILTWTTPCGNYMPTWTAVFIALIIIAKQRWL